MKLSKNNEPLIVDIKAPSNKGNFLKLQKKEVPDDNPAPRILLKITKGKSKIILQSSLAAFVIISAFYAISIFSFKKEAAGSIADIYGNFKKSAALLMNFEPAKAKSGFESVQKEIQKIKSGTPPGLILLASLFSKTMPTAFNNLNNLTGAAIDLSVGLEYLKNNGFGLIVNRQGGIFIDRLENVKNNLNRVSKLTAELKNQTSKFGYAAGEDYLATSVNLYKSRQFLESLIGWLKLPCNQHLLILFQNPSEMRPSGGFIGSYAHLTINQGSLTDINVNDIYDPDGQLDLKIIPPRPLQLITANWGARDANWFFDFPISARKVIEFLEASKIYDERLTKFAGAIAINVELIEDLLNVVGSIQLDEYNLIIDGKNFLSEVQKEVEAGKDKEAGEPKRILKVLTPILFEKIGGLNDEQKQNLLAIFKNHLQNKNIMLYFKDLALESYLQGLKVGGETVKLPNNFYGDYLAVVSANIGGAKSDAFVTQKIKLASKINIEGEINNELTIERAHQGQNQKDWWYRKTNKNFIQILTPRDSRLISAAGGADKTIKPPIDYAKNNYQIDTDLQALEESAKIKEDLNVQLMNQRDKTVFATWLDVPAGANKKLKLEYENPNRMPLGVDAPLNYQFIFEKQSGVQGGLEFSIEAPPGYKWKQGDKQTFTYSVDDPPARLVINLDLIQIE